MHRLHRKGICWRLWLWRRARARRRWERLTPAAQQQETERTFAEITADLARDKAREAKRNEPVEFATRLRDLPCLAAHAAKRNITV